jgi:hypothetical protein
VNIRVDDNLAFLHRHVYALLKKRAAYLRYG